MSRPEYRVHRILSGAAFAAEVATACGVPPRRLLIWRLLASIGR